MRRKIYIYERPEWPAFRWNSAALANQLAAVRHHQGRLLGRMEALGFWLQSETTLQMLTQDALKTSEIEGELLNHEQVRSSLARRLGLEKAGVIPVDGRADAIATVVLDASQDFAQPLTAERLFMWHRSLFPAGGTGRQPITVGNWRTDAFGAMIVTSGKPGREQIHFEAPPAARVPAEMARFLIWFEDKADATDPVLKAAVAHFWFVTIHPFDDGNGRIGRAIADMALARSERTSQRFYSMSTRLRVERAAYYETLETMQKGDLDITARLGWFLTALDQAHYPMPRRFWPRQSAKADFGRAWPGCRLTSASARCWAASSTASRESSRRRNGRRWPNARRTPPCATSPASLSAACWCKTRRAAGAPATA